MRWKQKEKYKSKDWHKYFAWCPVYLDGEVVWLEYVERRYEWRDCGVCMARFSEYRKIRKIT